MDVSQEQLLAFAVYELRLLLSGHLGSNGPDPSVRAAAHLAYALHNEALAVLDGRTFDTQKAIDNLGAVDRNFATNFQARLAEAVGNGA